MNEERLRSLLVNGLAGDVVAYRAFLSDLAGDLRVYLRPRLRSLPEEVEDLVQEVLLAIHNKRHTYRTDAPLTAWVRAIARYKLIDLLRRRSRGDALNDSLDDVTEAFETVSGSFRSRIRIGGVKESRTPTGRLVGYPDLEHFHCRSPNFITCLAIGQKRVSCCNNLLS